MILLERSSPYKDFRAISMGQGQEVHARKLIAQFMQTVSHS